MKRKRFSVEQIVTAVKLYESGTSIANICYLFEGIVCTENHYRTLIGNPK